MTSFYDEQLRRYILQFVRIFTQFQWRSGKDVAGNAILRTVPATYATMDRQVNSITMNNSENVVQSTPQISCWITSLKRNALRIQDPNYVRTMNVYEREYDELAKKYTSELGTIYNIETYMPVPYDLTMQTDIWTSSELQKQQLLEQILILFNPAIDLQTGNNPFDWTSLTIVELEDITWSSRTYPAGTTDTIDVASLTFRVPIWLTAPTKVKRQNIIEQIVIDIGRLEKMNQENGQGFYWTDADLISRLIVTPNNFSVSIDKNEITLLNHNNAVLDAEGNPMTWITLLQKYGKFRNNISQIRLKKSGSDIEDSSMDIIGILQLYPTDPMKMFWTVDMQTLPSNSLSQISAVIDPLKSYPGHNLDAAITGQRYLLLNDIPSGLAWGGITARQFDIIEFDGTRWNTSFDSTGNSTYEYVLNSRTNQQLHWNGEFWHLAIDGEYSPGYWRLAL